MKPIYVHFGGALALSFTIAACVPAPDSTPEPQPSPTQVPVTVVPAEVTTPAPPAAKNWIDNPRTPGTWRYRGPRNGTAEYVSPQGAVLLQLECTADRDVTLAVRGNAPSASAIVVRTETASRTLSADAREGWVETRLAARDPLLDAMAITRGRFAVETSGLSTLYLPPWAEVTRAIEDCR